MVFCVHQLRFGPHLEYHCFQRNQCISDSIAPVEELITIDNKSSAWLTPELNAEIHNQHNQCISHSIAYLIVSVKAIKTIESLKN